MADAEKIASKQKQISISEFFEKNKHFLGFDTLQRAVITAVKEAVDNSLDACEEARILPTIKVEINKLKSDKIELICQDNGPGIPRDSIANVFGKFLLGSRFHAIRQTRGQQGIGITGVVMYSQLTTGSKTHVISKTQSDTGAVHLDIGLDTRKNRAIKTNEKREPWMEDGEEVSRGLKIKTVMKAKYQRGRQSVHQYLRMTSIVNPHATIELTVRDPEGITIEKAEWVRTSGDLPKIVSEVQPHPESTTLAQLQRMLKETEKSTLQQFLNTEFSSMPVSKAKRIIEIAGLQQRRSPSRIKTEEAAAIVAALTSGEIRYLIPKNIDSCLSPIEDLLIKKGLAKAIDSRFASTVTRNPILIRGVPFQVEVGLVFGGDLTSDGPIEVLRFANRVPLMYQQGGCILTKALESVDWKRYGLDHPGGKGLPKGPAAVLIHLASTNVQFTSEAKEAVADNEELKKEIRIAVQEVGRGLQNHLKKSKQRKKAQEKFDLINIILPEISRKSSEMLDREEPDLAPVITRIMNAVFLEDDISWDNNTKQNICSVTIYNYTARARAYTILAKWPEGEDVRMIDNPRGGRKETNGLWAWRLDTLNPGESTEIRFTVEGLSKGDWNETEIFFRGNGDIIGANKIDEKLLDEMRKAEALAAAEAEHARSTELGTIERVLDRAEPVEALEGRQGEYVSESIPTVAEVIPGEDEDWFGMKDGGAE